jgi:hypothetical protein
MSQDKKNVQHFAMKYFNIFHELGDEEQFGGTTDRFVLAGPCEVKMYLEILDMVDLVNGLIRWDQMVSDKDDLDSLVKAYTKRLGRDYSPHHYLIAKKIGDKIKIRILEFDFITGYEKGPQLCLKMKISPTDDVYQLCSWLTRRMRDSKESKLEIKEIYD